MSKFNEADVLTLAKAVVDDHLAFENDYNDSRYTGFHCFFCEGDGEDGSLISERDPSKIVHELDCPVLIAIDICS